MRQIVIQFVKFHVTMFSSRAIRGSLLVVVARAWGVAGKLARYSTPIKGLKGNFRSDRPPPGGELAACLFEQVEQGEPRVDGL